MIQLILFSYIMLTILIYIKYLIIPTLLFLLPVTDFRSTLFELIILLIGVFSSFLYFAIGYYAKNGYQLRRGSLLFLLIIYFLPAFISHWLYPFTWIKVWSKLLIDLIAEPYRLLTYSYQYSERVGLFIFILVTTLGYLVGKIEEGRYRGLTTKRQYQMRL